MFSIFAITLSLLAVYTGIRAIHTHHAFFLDFRLRDFINGRVDSWLYLCMVLPTVGCCVALFFRITKGLEFVSEGASDYWPILHGVWALNAIACSITVSRLLKRSEFCKTCKMTTDQRLENARK